MSKLEEAYELQLRAAKVGGFVREHRFAPPRRFRFDFAWPEVKVAVEIEGGVYVKGRHTTGTGFTKDCEKYNLAVINGWLVLRFTGHHVKTGEALTQTERLLDQTDLEFL